MHPSAPQRVGSAPLRPAPRGSLGGLTPVQAVLLIAALGLLGAAFDAATGRGLRTGFAVCFVPGCVLAAAKVQRAGLLAVLAAPPLVFATFALGVGLAPGSGVPRTPTRQAIELFTQLVLGAPILIVATLAALLVGGIRLLQHR